MQSIAEMRSALAAEFEKNPRNGPLPNAPDWAIRFMFEKLSGTKLTPLPREIEARRVRTATAYRKNAAPAVVTDEEAEREIALMRARVELAKRS